MDWKVRDIDYMAQAGEVIACDTEPLANRQALVRALAATLDDEAFRVGGMVAVARVLDVPLEDNNSGFSFRYEDRGVSVSVQWGPGTYSEHSSVSDGEKARIARLPVGEWDSVDAEVYISGMAGEPVIYQRVPAAEVTEIVYKAIAWKPLLPDEAAMTQIVTFCKKEIDDDCRASEDDDEPGIQLTVGWDGYEDWSFQTGDNSFTGGAYGYRHWGVVSVYRDSVASELVEDIHNQLEELRCQ